MQKVRATHIPWGSTAKAIMVRTADGNAHWLPRRFTTFTPDKGQEDKIDKVGTVIMPTWLHKKVIT
jgi:hypothetical protein